MSRQVVILCDLPHLECEYDTLLNLDSLPDEMIEAAAAFVEHEVNLPNFEMGVAMEPKAFAEAVLRAALLVELP